MHLTFDNISNIAAEIRKKLGQGVILSVNGPLGIGKTTLIKNILPEKKVSSPSFLHLLLYDDDFAHLDAYTLKSAQHLAQMEIEEILQQRCLIVEWGNLFTAELQNYDAKLIQLTISMQNEERFIEIEML